MVKCIKKFLPRHLIYFLNIAKNKQKHKIKIDKVCKLSCQADNFKITVQEYDSYLTVYILVKNCGLKIATNRLPIP